ncbi:predicted protein [Nematostella vectensis]|uniref:Uncharacterized protein n=1 Tax=Nematostella vectensis TaxID=45351 RepID=A7RXU4_NEMVE|nr:predicted protein [Nematostella vectensis]|eukprot:XP_001635746.1 predicted protein [Nematostella vectensis]
MARIGPEHPLYPIINSRSLPTLATMRDSLCTRVMARIGPEHPLYPIINSRSLPTLATRRDSLCTRVMARIGPEHPLYPIINSRSLPTLATRRDSLCTRVMARIGPEHPLYPIINSRSLPTLATRRDSLCTRVMARIGPEHPLYPIINSRSLPTLATRRDSLCTRVMARIGPEHPLYPIINSRSLPTLATRRDSLCTRVMARIGGPCVDYNRPVKSAFEAHLDPAIRNFAIKKKYDLYYERLLKGVHPPDPSPREQAMMDDSSASYFIRTPLAGLTAGDIPLKGKQKNQESSNAESIDSTNGSLTEMDRGTQALLKTRPIPTIMITKGSSSEIGKGSTDMSTSSQRSLEV